MKHIALMALFLSFSSLAQGFKHEDLLDINIGNSGMDKKKVKEYLAEGSPTAGKNKCLQGKMTFLKPKLDGQSPFLIIKNKGKVLVAIGSGCNIINCDSDFLANPKVDFPPVFTQRNITGSKKVIFKGDFAGVNDPAIDWDKGSVTFQKDGKFQSGHFDDPVKNLNFVGQIEKVHTFECGDKKPTVETEGSSGSPSKNKPGKTGNAGAQ